MIIAIDGPAGSGKGTVSQSLAKRLRFAYLDTGLLYRALAWTALHKGAAMDDITQLSELAKILDMDSIPVADLRAPLIAETASRIAAYGVVREALTEYMRAFAYHPAQGYKGVILDGRDIGTVVCPEAPLKFFITASLEERAKRRFQELQLKGFQCSLEEVLHDVQHRDERDQSRSKDPLRPALDSVIIDTTTLSLEDVLQQVLNHILKMFPDSIDSSS